MVAIVYPTQAQRLNTKKVRMATGIARAT